MSGPTEAFGLSGAGKSTILGDLVPALRDVHGVPVRHPKDQPTPSRLAILLRAGALALAASLRAPVPMAGFLASRQSWWLLQNLAHRLEAQRRSGAAPGSFLVDSGLLQLFVSFSLEIAGTFQGAPLEALLRAIPLPGRAVYVRVAAETARDRYVARGTAAERGQDPEALGARFESGFAAAELLERTCRARGVPLHVIDTSERVLPEAIAEVAAEIARGGAAPGSGGEDGDMGVLQKVRQRSPAQLAAGAIFRLRLLLNRQMSALLRANHRLYLRWRFFVQRRLAFQELYQPDPFEPVKDRSFRPGADRLEAFSRVLPEGPLSVLDLGCSNGFFVLSLAKRGGFCVGLDIDRRPLMIAESFASRHGIENAVFAHREIDAESALSLPVVDVVICLSIFHHFVNQFGEEAANDLMRALASRASRFLVFETGQVEESNKDWAAKLRFMEPDSRAWIEGYVRDLGFDRVHHVGNFPSAVSDIHRHLVVGERTS